MARIEWCCGSTDIKNLWILKRRGKKKIFNLGCLSRLSSSVVCLFINTPPPLTLFANSICRKSWRWKMWSPICEYECMTNVTYFCAYPSIHLYLFISIYKHWAINFISFHFFFFMNQIILWMQTQALKIIIKPSQISIRSRRKSKIVE